MIKRLFDIVSSLIGLVVFLPFFILICLLILITSKGGIFYSQVRVCKGNTDFNLLKFRTMKPDSDKTEQLTIGTNDSRITGIGKFLRKFKLDEIPQLLNVLRGEMSIVGPRPEVRKYVSLYSQEQLKVLSVRPGLTDLASIEFINENEILGKSDNPEKEYIVVIMPKKLNLNLQYIESQSFLGDIKLIFRTFSKILK
ncbi:MAG: sugar transferase [Flavobacteriales bacterium]|nr:sugar transferase [Flavobacteriales bacterium]